MNPPRTHTPRAFTIVELMIALATASIVVSGALGLFTFLYRSEARLSAAAPQQTALTITHTAIMRTMGTLAAGVPLTAPDEDLDEDDEDADPDEIDLEEFDLGNEELERQLADLFAGAVPDETIQEAVALAFAPPPAQFELFHDDRNTGELFPTLEVSLTSSPLPRTRSLLFNEPLDEDGFAIDRDFQESLRGVIRGAFEITLLHDGFALQWAWLDEPDLEPRILLRKVHNIEWLVLVRIDLDEVADLPEDTDEQSSPHAKEWREVHAAFLAEDFPLACRLQIEMQDGSFIDWMFETAVSIPEQPS
jgi:type II secretory pathway pseudopilin PulG